MSTSNDDLVADLIWSIEHLLDQLANVGVKALKADNTWVLDMTTSQRAIWTFWLQEVQSPTVSA